MNIGDNEPITGGEREHFERKKGYRLVFSAPPCSSIPNCPVCGHNRKVFKGGDKYVCSEFHTTNAQSAGTDATNKTMNEPKPEDSSRKEVDSNALLVNGIKFSYRRDENAYLAKYVGDDDHYGAERLKGGSWVPVIYQDDGWQADYVDGVYGEFSEAVEAAWDYLS